MSRPRPSAPQVIDIDHDWCHSIYVTDPNGILVEFCTSIRAFTDADREDALRLLADEEAARLINDEEVKAEAVRAVVCEGHGVTWPSMCGGRSGVPGCRRIGCVGPGVVGLPQQYEKT